MAVPTTRAEFKDYVMRNLGWPVIEINLDDDQIEDRIDEGLKYYYDYHFDGSEKTYYKHLITASDITNRYITLPDTIQGVVGIFPISYPGSSANMFSDAFQLTAADMAMALNGGMTSYYLSREQLSLVNELLVGQKPFRYQRHNDRVYIDMTWNSALEGTWLIIEAYEIVDPDTYSDVWGDRWLARYVTALVQRNWGRALTKFIGQQLPGGLQFNGAQILADAERDIEKMEQEMTFSYSIPPQDLIG